MKHQISDDVGGYCFLFVDLDAGCWLEAVGCHVEWWDEDAYREYPILNDMELSCRTWRAFIVFGSEKYAQLFVDRYLNEIESL